MALTDTAEYWWDVKRNHPYTGPDYSHIPGYDCGHRHLYEAKNNLLTIFSDKKSYKREEIADKINKLL